MVYEIEPEGVCSIKIEITVNDNIIQEVKFVGGCPGNTLGIANLLKGVTTQEAIKRLKGIDCKGRGTSCPDQLAIGLEKIIKKSV